MVMQYSGVNIEINKYFMPEDGGGVEIGSRRRRRRRRQRRRRGVNISIN